MNQITLIGVVDNDLISIKNARGQRVALEVVTQDTDEPVVMDREIGSVKHYVDAFDELAGFAYGNLIKGSLVYVEGRLAYGDFLRDDGKLMKSFPHIRASRLESLDG